MLNKIIPDAFGNPEPGYAKRVTWLIALALAAIVVGFTLGFVVDESPSTAPQTISPAKLRIQ